MKRGKRLWKKYIYVNNDETSMKQVKMSSPKKTREIFGRHSKIKISKGQLVMYKKIRKKLKFIPMTSACGCRKTSRLTRQNELKILIIGLRNRFGIIYVQTTI